MLLLTPPWTREEWIETKFTSPNFDEALGRYCRCYEQTVLEMPERQLGKVVAYLSGGLTSDHIGAETFQKMVRREVDEERYEPSNKVTKLVILVALAESLARRGIRVSEATEAMLELCREVVPALLIVAVDDHFGILQHDSYSSDLTGSQ